MSEGWKPLCQRSVGRSVLELGRGDTQGDDVVRERRRTGLRSFPDAVVLRSSLQESSESESVSLWAVGDTVEGC